MLTPLRLVTPNDLDLIHESTLNLLEETGFVFYHEEALNIFKRAGAKIDEQIVRMPRRLVEKALDSVPSEITLIGRNPEHTATLGSKQERPVVSPNNGNVFISDIEGGRRLGTLKDYANIIKLCQATDLVDVPGAIPVHPHELNDNPAQHLLILFHCLKNTDKPVLGFVLNGREIKEQFELMEIVYGGSLYERGFPCIGVGINPLSPLKLSESACETMMSYAEAGQVVYISSCVMAGITAPIGLLGAAILMNTEIIACTVLAQLINPGCPTVYQTSSTVADMRSYSYATGSPEANLINIIGQQMAHDVYNMTTRAMACLTDSKSIDFQAGVETMQNVLLLVLAGVNHINETLGVLESIMTTSYEKFILDLEILERVFRIYRGLQGSDREVSLSLIKEVGPFGHYMTHQDTLDKWKNRWVPRISDWSSYDEWQRKGEDLLARANKNVKEILFRNSGALLDKTIENEMQTYILNRYQGAERYLSV